MTDLLENAYRAIKKKSRGSADATWHSDLFGLLYMILRLLVWIVRKEAHTKEFKDWMGL